MAITYTWEILDLKVETNGNNGLKDVVSGIKWRLTAVDDVDGLSHMTSGRTQLDPPESLKFVAFEDLTKEIVVGWIETSMVKTVEDPETLGQGGQKQYITIDDLQPRKDFLQQKIVEKRNPPVMLKKPPWISGSENI